MSEQTARRSLNTEVKVVSEKDGIIEYIASDESLDTHRAFQNSWSPCQIGKIQLNTSCANTLQRRLLKPVWCTYDPEATIHIASGDTVEWAGAKDLQGNIEVQRGAQLTIRCTNILPQGAKVKVHQGGTLILDGGTITNYCGQKWQGIEIEQRPRRKARLS